MFSPRSLWLIRALTWDGLLPLIVVLGTFFIRIAGQGFEELQLIVVFFVPLIFAFVRAHLAWGQIARTCHGQVPVLRQIAVAAAIVALLCFETASNALTMTDKEPPEAWLAVGGFYLAYLALICFALRPCRDPNAGPIESSNRYETVAASFEVR